MSDNRLEIGQKLWGINIETQKEEFVTVVDLKANSYRVEYNGKRCWYDNSTLGMKFYFYPKGEKYNSAEKSCDKCLLRYNNECTSLSGSVCEDYIVKQQIDRSEREYWPQYGDALAIGFHNRKRFK